MDLLLALCLGIGVLAFLAWALGFWC